MYQKSSDVEIRSYTFLRFAKGVVATEFILFSGMSVWRVARKMLHLSSSLRGLEYAYAGSERAMATRQFGSSETVMGSVASEVADGFEVSSDNQI